MKVTNNKPVLLQLLFYSLLLFPELSQAFNWNNLWLRPDQQGAQALAHGKAEQAAQLFTNPEWQAVARYRAGQYQQAITLLTPINSSDAYYNRGNALAHLGDYPAAITAYEQALKLNPQHKDAKFNKELLQKLLNQQSNQSSKEQQASSSTNQPDTAPATDKNPSEPGADSNTNDDNNPTDSSLPNSSSPTDKPREKNSQQQSAPQPPDPKQQALQQWLQQIPDDPGGLLRQKFLRDYRKARQQ